jgi:hypothetical protein
MLSDRPKASVTLNQRPRNFQYIGQKYEKLAETVHFIQQRSSPIHSSKASIGERDQDP